MIREWLAVAKGGFEALTALSGYSYEHVSDVFPEFVEHGPLFDGGRVSHIRYCLSSKAVQNDVKLGDGLNLIVSSAAPTWQARVRSFGVLE